MRRPALDDDGTPVLLETVLDVLVLTQSCDINKSAQDQVLLARIYKFEDAMGRWSKLKQGTYRKALVEGSAVGDFLLPPAPTRPDWMLAHFRHLFVVPKDEAKAATSRLELMSPYREHLSQAFGRFMMRVGLPSGLEPCLDSLPQ